MYKYMMTEVVPPDDFRGYGLFALCADIKWSIQNIFPVLR